jgi:gamma-glutamylputrescine oxidase
LPVVEEVRPKVWALGGYSGTGNVIGALAARAVVAAIGGDCSQLALLQGSAVPARLPE